MRKSIFCFVFIASLLIGAQPSPAAESAAQAESQSAPVASATSSSVSVTVNKSVVLENAAGVKRISITNPELAEAVAASTTEVLLNGKAPGDTTLILWDRSGHRTMFDVHVIPSDAKVEMVKAQLATQLPGQDVNIKFESGSVFLEGSVKDLVSADRALKIASALGNVTNLLNVAVPASEPQVLLKVRFADIDRTALAQFGVNLFSTGAAKMPGSTSTGQFAGPPSFDYSQSPPKVAIPDPLNIFVFRNDLNFGAYIKALQDKQLVQILAEPNLLTLSGHEASFLAGGEFPFPMLQGGGAGIGQITIEFREFGIRLRFRPTVTPRGTIRLFVNPEVSALDSANGLTIQGYTIPGLDTRRVQTNVELQNGQSFMIAGLLDNRLTETISKIPGLANIPLLGKLFESRGTQRNNTELMVLVTPEIVQPIPPGKTPELPMPKPFLKGIPTEPPQNPVADSKLGPTIKAIATLPVEVLRTMQETEQANESTDQPNGGSNTAPTANQILQNMQPTPIAHH